MGGSLWQDHLITAPLLTRIFGANGLIATTKLNHHRPGTGIRRMHYEQILWGKVPKMWIGPHARKGTILTCGRCKEKWNPRHKTKQSGRNTNLFPKRKRSGLASNRRNLLAAYIEDKIASMEEQPVSLLFRDGSGS